MIAVAVSAIILVVFNGDNSLKSALESAISKISLNITAAGS
ncbi:hypothetical protein EXA18_10480 [Vibrio cincinnatiensis]|nr:hypothetical protein [Vibrio cincinnatiensis]